MTDDTHTHTHTRRGRDEERTAWTERSDERRLVTDGGTDPVEYVDPFIGTDRSALAGDASAMVSGNVYPGATTPHGMVAVSPDTDDQWETGYRYSDDSIRGFSQTHVPGTGCPGLGHFPTMATTGPVSTVPDDGFETTELGRDANHRDTRAVLSFDVAGAVRNGTLYVRLDDPTEADGFGPSLYSVKLTVDGSVVADFETPSSAEDPYYDPDSTDAVTGSGDSRHRFANKSSFIAYEFDGLGDVSSATLELDVKNDYVVSAGGPTEGYASAFEKATEEAEAGYYGVTLADYGIDVDLTATTRVGVTRYTFPSTSEANVLLPVAETLDSSPTIDASVEWLSPSSLHGSVTVAKPFCGDAEKPLTAHFYAEFDTPADTTGTYAGDTVSPGSPSASGTDVGAYAQFSTSAGQAVTVKVGVSYVSRANAKANVEAEVPDFDFAGVRDAARTEWNERLSRIRVEGRDEQKTKFYSMLYRAFLGPTVFEDVTGEYRGLDDQVHLAETDDGERYHHYSMFSLWDTFRTEHPLLNLVAPEVQTDAVRSLIDAYEEGGWLPKWEFQNRYTDVMIANHAASVIGESYLKGLREYDVETALDAMVKNSTETPFPSAQYSVLDESTSQATRAERTYDLTPYLGEEAVRVRVGDAVETDGFGGKVYGVTVQATVDGSTQTVAEFSPDTAAEDDYLIQNSGAIDGGARFADRTTSFTYEFPVPDGATGMRVTLDVQNQYRIEAAGAALVDRTPFDGIIGIEEYQEYGYIPDDLQYNRKSVWDTTSATVENAYCDYAIGEMAADLGRSGTAATFRDRAGNWKNVFDPVTGFSRPRNADGSWYDGEKDDVADHFDPRSWHGFTEGNAWTYTWFAPHQMGELVEAMGETAFVEKLDHLFEKFVFPSAFDNPFDHYWQGNEPSHHVPYLYVYAGHPWKTQEVVQDTMTQLYGTDPSGIPGNEDVGQMGAWYVMSAMGFYPVAPAQGTYVLGAPAFERVELDLPADTYGDATFTVEVTGESFAPDAYRYVTGASLDGESLDRAWIRHEGVTNGATLELQTDTEPSDTWATDAPLPSKGSPAAGLVGPGPVSGDTMPGDLDQDGRLEDVDGDGSSTYDDVVTFFEEFGEDGVRSRPSGFDFNANGRLDFDDIVELFRSTS
jgi:putative alpha-1,2-mannosidase